MRKKTFTSSLCRNIGNSVGFLLLRLLDDRRCLVCTFLFFLASYQHCHVNHCFVGLDLHCLYVFLNADLSIIIFL